MDAQRRRAEERIDRILVGVAGVATAVIAAGAATLIASPDPDPHFPGGEHLAIFARPSTGLPAATARAARDFGVHETPVGGVAPAAPRPGPAAAAAPPTAERGLARWRVHDVIGAEVYLIGPSGLVAARVGADLGEAGIVENIAVERSGYVVTTSKGRIVPAR
jgi:hypothetical protein